MNLESAATPWPTVAVVGAGAVGCYFGAMLARAGAPVTLIGRPVHMDAITAQGLLLERTNGRERIAIATATRLSAAQHAQIVLICVKTVDTESTARQLGPDLAPGALVLSLQNGVDNVARMRAAAQIDAMPAVVYVAAAMVGPGHLRHSGRGDLIVGEPRHGRTVGTSRGVELAALADTFGRAGIPVRIVDDIDAQLWTKMALNCAYNAISALGRARYGDMAQLPQILELMRNLMIETVAVAHAEGVALDETAMITAGFALARSMPGANSSTAQDIERGRPTEIDSLNGYIARRGRELAVATPRNEALYALIKLLERASAQR